MQKAYAFLLLVSCFCSAFCQQPEKRKAEASIDGNSVISMYPFQFIFSSFKLGFEQKISEKLSFKGMASLGLNEHSLIYDVENYSAFSIEGQLRYFPMKKSLSGIYGAVYFYDRGASFEEFIIFPGPFPIPATTTYNLNSIGGGVLFGVQLFARKIVSFDFYAGGGPNIPIKKAPTNNPNNTFGSDLIFNNYRKAIGFHSGFSIGLVLK
jgi:hypothetical protein